MESPWPGSVLWSVRSGALRSVLRFTPFQGIRNPIARFGIPKKWEQSNWTISWKIKGGQQIPRASQFQFLCNFDSPICPTVDMLWYVPMNHVPQCSLWNCGILEVVPMNIFPKPRKNQYTSFNGFTVIRCCQLPCGWLRNPPVNK